MRIYKSTEPFVWEGRGDLSSTALLLVHGFTGSPSEFRRAAYYWNDTGYTVSAVRLPGHGTKPEDMILTGWTDWWGHVLQAYDQLKAQGFEQIVAVGHSMGGLLSLLLSLERHLDGVVSLGTPIYVNTRNAVFARYVHRFIKYVAKKPSTYSSLIREESCAYDRTPVKCVVSLQHLVRKVKKSLHQVKVPLLIVQGLKDQTVQPRSADYIYHRSNSEIKEVAYFPNTSHAILLDEERVKVYKQIDRFVQTIRSGNPKRLEHRIQATGLTEVIT
ncbi:alpha/beta hydrolase [Marinicrinis lubricantis]|uniref:Alpha/beta hydrolase n=1 Tax=Marinicrinis lubricantis TaxID=2086470 RepID=A0ABW1IPY3_9BACL